MDNTQQITAIEKELLDLIISHLENNQMEFPIAQKLARDFLALLPARSKVDLLEKLRVLGETYSEAQTVYLMEFSKDLQAKEQAALIQMQQAIKQGNIDHAIAVAKSVYANT